MKSWNSNSISATKKRGSSTANGIRMTITGEIIKASSTYRLSYIEILTPAQKGLRGENDAKYN